jgi:hypothetical protein
MQRAEQHVKMTIARIALISNLLQSVALRHVDRSEQQEYVANPRD